MQSAPAHAPRRRWLRWGQILAFGVVLGLLQLLLILGVGLLQSWPFVWLPVITLAALFYLLIPALAGFQATRHSGNDASGTGAGWMTGGISFLVILIVVVGAIALIPGALQPQCQPRCNIGGAVAAEAAAQTAIFLFFLVEGAAGLVGGLLGGWFGGLLGHRYAAAANQRGRTPENNAS